MSNQCLEMPPASAASPGTQITHAGILLMPHELLLEVTKHIDSRTGQPERPKQMLGHLGGTPEPYPPNSERRTALRALSQTSRAMRQLFLPLAWEYLDTCSAKYDHFGYDNWMDQCRSISENLESKSKGLISNPNLAAYVRVVTVRIVLNSVPVLHTFAECLQSLPNVHTLHITDVVGRLTTAIQKAFKAYRFLPIRTVILPVSAHHILISCPHVRVLACAGYQENLIVGTIAKKCKQLEELSIKVYKSDTIDHIAKGIPNLCQVSLYMVWNHFNVDSLRALVSLPRLHTIIFCEQRECDQLSSPPEDNQARFQPLLNAAIGVLKTHEGDKHGKKWVKAWCKMTYGSREIEDTVWTQDVEVEG